MATVIFRQEGTSFDEDVTGKRAYVRVWHCEADDNRVGPLAIRTQLFLQKGITIGVPYVSEAFLSPYYEFDNGAVCSRIHCDHISGSQGKAWNITTNYDPIDPDRVNPDDP